MKIQPSLSAIVMLPILCGCTTSASIPEPTFSAAKPVAMDVSYDAPRETVLLVSLEDGSVIKQMIDADADICFKQISSTATTCLSEGAPIIDPATNSIIGFEMVENHIDLVARPD